MVMMSAKMNDKELVELYMEGNERALSYLLEKHKQRIYTTIFFLVKDEALADDIFQDTFIKVIKNLQSGNYNNEGKFASWAIRIARNLCMDHFRGKKRMPNFYSTDENFDIFKVLKYNESNPDEVSYKDYAGKVIQGLIKDLPDEQRQVLVLRHYADMNYKEIATMTGVTVNTAIGRMRYAILKLKKMLGEQQIAIEL